MPRKSYATSERVKKASGYLDDIEKPLVTNTDTVDKEGTIDTVDKKGNQNLMWWRNPSLLLFQKKQIYTINKKRSHKHPEKSPYLSKK